MIKKVKIWVVYFIGQISEEQVPDQYEWPGGLCEVVLIPNLLAHRHHAITIMTLKSDAKIENRKINPKISLQEICIFFRGFPKICLFYFYIESRSQTFSNKHTSFSCTFKTFPPKMTTLFYIITPFFHKCTTVFF